MNTNDDPKYGAVRYVDLILGLGALIAAIVDVFQHSYLILFSAGVLGYFLVKKVLFFRGLERLSIFLKRAATDNGLAAPPDLPVTLKPFVRDIEAFIGGVRSDARDTRLMTDTLRDLVASAEDSIANLAQSFDEQRGVTDQATQAMKEASSSLKEIASNVEALAESAEESSSSILEMTTTNEEVAENMLIMGNSVRETVSSIGEMAYSIKEVAGNIDALSATTEETSSAINEMDTSIDQVQSNADETTSISGDVSKDAERGADAISKTLETINRIKDSSQIAVEVISSLGQKIEEIGQILNVIDDVAEQTNLLALNAAIIAAQAGEHGKGFAVVADEIKELAERSGVSTKEIAELIKAIQSESRNAIAAVEQGNSNVDEGVNVSAEAEQALRKILESAKRSTNMMRAIARATVEQSRGSKQVTDAISRIAETVQQIAGATSDQARGSELIIKGAEKMRSITQHVERSTSEQAKGGRQVTKAIETISQMVNQLNAAHRQQQEHIESILELSRRIERISEGQDQSLSQVRRAFGAVKEAMTMGQPE
ncbi:MAG: methyl-accepting chemotaxis protein [Myxococcota bacterium]|nr:methyl-accepting chemotaxis protein [Myxococcota bacterium]